MVSCGHRWSAEIAKDRNFRVLGDVFEKKGMKIIFLQRRRKNMHIKFLKSFFFGFFRLFGFFRFSIAPLLLFWAVSFDWLMGKGSFWYGCNENRMENLAVVSQILNKISKKSSIGWSFPLSAQG